MNTRARRIRMAWATVALAVVGAVVWTGCGRRSAAPPGYVPRPKGSLTFNKDIAPIIFQNCSLCHRPGESAPFPLLTHPDVARRAKLIAEVTARRSMPPWLPEPGYGEFEGQRLLTVDQLGILQQWINEGVVEGVAADRPAPPKWGAGWRLGEPDLIVKMPEAYTLGPEGKDVYRNFVIPIPLAARRFVNAVEFHPNSRAVHHAFIRFDRTPESRRRDEQEPGLGFPGLHTPASAMSPEGFFLSWQPGKTPAREREGLSWSLEPGTDLVLQIHLQPSGRPEPVQPAVGFYFTDTPPARTPFKIGFRGFNIDIPAGDTNYVVLDSYKLPVAADVLAVLPHAHYLARDLQAFATLPDGTRQWLFWIKDWNFNWQGDYVLAHPLSLPQGATVSMGYTYDNSAANPRNPHQPPRRVQYGVQSTDEMGELWVQLLPPTPDDFKLLSRDFSPRFFDDALAYNRYLLRLNPRDARALCEIGKVMLARRRQLEAWTHFRNAIDLDPGYDEPHYYLGLMARMDKKRDDAIREFQTTLRLNPEHAKAHGNLGMVFAELGDKPRAGTHFREAIRLNAGDVLAHGNLGLLLLEQGDLDGAGRHLETALRLNPADELLREHVARVARLKAEKAGK